MPERNDADSAGAGGDAGDSPATASRTGMNRVWLRFKKTTGARFGLWLVGVFTLTALLAPFIAHRLPFVWYDCASGELSWPLIREFFAPSDTTEPGLERGINFLFLFAPPAFVVWRLLGRLRPEFARRSSRLVSLLFGVLIALALWAAIGGMVVDGGGGDWFHDEQAPVPEIDDIQDPAAPLTVDRPATPELMRLAGLIQSGAAPDEQRRAAIAPLQQLIEGPAILPKKTLAFDRLGLDPEHLATALDRARWNRLVVERAFPGFLSPMRRFRGAFLTLAAASLAALLGLTYICLAGAWQFALSPRWLVLLALALVLAQLFRLPARHDHAPYRQLHADGTGWGVFPPIPYGPNEQGFGPKLPPSWSVGSALYRPEDILSAEAALGLAPPELREKLPGPDRSGPDAMADALNAVLSAGQELDLRPSTANGSAGPYVEAINSGRALSPEERLRFRRLIMDGKLSGAVRPVNAAHWKKPSNAPGYHLIGTDESGRDVLVRVIHGARVSLSVGFVSVFLATVVGLVLGALAAYYGGRTDMLISRFLEIMMCFPSFFLILAVIAVLDQRSIVNIMLVIGLTSWTGVARLVRGEMLRQKKMDYVAASIALGASDTRTIFRHILPNAMAPVLVSISFGVTGAILTEAGLSFIGFGVTPPTPTWGQLLSETRDSPLANWWLALFPGLVLFMSVMAYNLVGEAVRDALDPRTTL